MTDHEMSADDYQAYLKSGVIPTKRNKFNAQPVEIDGRRFDSAAEGDRYRELTRREEAGEISGLEMQVHYPIRVNGEHICTYIADFQYFDYDLDRIVVEDVKGMKTRDYQLKKKLMKAVHGIEIHEVKR